MDHTVESLEIAGTSYIINPSIAPKSKIVFNADGSITTEYADMKQTTTFESDGSIKNTFTYTDGTEIVRTTSFNPDGSIEIN